MPASRRQIAATALQPGTVPATQLSPKQPTNVFFTLHKDKVPLRIRMEWNGMEWNGRSFLNAESCHWNSIKNRRL